MRTLKGWTHLIDTIGRSEYIYCKSRGEIAAQASARVTAVYGTNQSQSYSTDELPESCFREKATQGVIKYEPSKNSGRPVS